MWHDCVRLLSKFSEWLSVPPCLFECKAIPLDLVFVLLIVNNELVALTLI